MKAEWLTVREYDSDESRTAYLADFLNYYNHERPRLVRLQATVEPGADAGLPHRATGGVAAHYRPVGHAYQSPLVEC